MQWHARALQGEADESDEDEAGAVVDVNQVAHADADLAVGQDAEVLVLACHAQGAWAKGKATAVQKTLRQEIRGGAQKNRRQTTIRALMR